MRYIKPKDITDSVLVSSDVPETDHAAWSSGTTYALNDYVIVAAEHKIYKSLQNANTNKTPATEPTWWADQGYTNTWRMFDGYINTQTSQASQIEVVLDANKCDAVGLLDIDANSVTFELTYDGDVISTVTVDLLRNTSTSWSDYFFGEIEYKTDLIQSIPLYGANATVKVTITKTAGDATCGLCIVGRMRYLGGTRYGIRAGILDYSKKSTDDFGRTYLSQTDSWKKENIVDVIVDNGSADAIYKTLAGLRAVPVVWMADDDNGYETLIVYGFWRAFDLNFSTPVKSYYSLEIEGLI
jgi:hypothetical protein